VGESGRGTVTQDEARRKRFGDRAASDALTSEREAPRQGCLTPHLPLVSPHRETSHGNGVWGMHDLYEGIELNKAQTEVICRGLLDLARVDGLHDNEVALIHEFYKSGGGEGDIIDSLSADDFDLATASRTLQKEGGPAVVEAFIMSCYLLIYADGRHSDEERARIAVYANHLGVDRIRLEELHVNARLYLLKVLAAEIRNKDAIREVGTELGLSDEAITGAMKKED
jgi:hypothetical protein